MQSGWVDHHLLQGYSDEKRHPETFLVNMVVPVLWHQVPRALPQSAGWHSGHLMKFNSNQH